MSQFTIFFQNYGLFAMFLCILLEYGCFPVSSEIILPLSGAMASHQGIPLFVMLPVSIVAGLIGTSFCFFVGKGGGNKILNKLTTRFPKMQKPLQSSFQTFDKYGAYAVCVGRVIPICRTYIAFVAGASGQSYPAFLFSSLFGIAVWNTLLIGLGYGLKDNWNVLISYYDRYKHVILLLLIGLLSVSLIHAVLKRKKNHT